MTDQTITVNVNQGPTLQQHVFWVVFLGILAVMFWKWVVPIVLTAAVAYWAYASIQRNAAAQAEIRARADQQRNWFEQGDPRALFGPDYVAEP